MTMSQEGISPCDTATLFGFPPLFEVWETPITLYAEGNKDFKH